MEILVAWKLTKAGVLRHVLLQNPHCHRSGFSTPRTYHVLVSYKMCLLFVNKNNVLLIARIDKLIHDMLVQAARSVSNH